MVVNENTSTATIVAAVAAATTPQNVRAYALVKSANKALAAGRTNEARTLAVRAAMVVTDVHHGAQALAAL